MKRSLAGLSLFMVLIMLGVAGHGAEMVDRIVAVVNDDIITYLELQQEIAPYAKKLKAMNYPVEKQEQMLFKIQDDILNQLIERKLTDQEIDRQEIMVDDAEVDKRVEFVMTRNQMTEAELEKALERDGLTLAAYKTIIKEQLLREKLVNTEVKSKTVITQEEIEAHYYQHADQFSGERQLHLRNILMVVSPLASEIVKNEVKARMAAVMEQLQNGADFADLAASYSEAPQARQGGDLGRFKFSDISLKLQKALDKLAVGEHTGILETDQGYQIFYVEGIQRHGGKTLEEAAPEIERKLFEEQVSQKFLAWMKDLRQRSHIKIIQ